MEGGERLISIDLERSAFEQLFNSNYDDLMRYVVRRVGPTNSDDIVAEVFLIAWQKCPIDFTSTDSRLWVFRVAHNLIANELRARKRRAATEIFWIDKSPPPGTVVADPLDGILTGLDIRVAFAKLSPLDREVLALLAWDGFSLKDAAIISGCSQATFRVRLHRARIRLSNLIASAETSPNHRIASESAMTRTVGANVDDSGDD